MRMTAGLDEGPILGSAETRIDQMDTAGTLHDRLARMGAGLMISTLAKVERRQEIEAPQAMEGAIYARKIRPSECRIVWERPAGRVDGQIRGLAPSPGAWFVVDGERGPIRVKALLSRCEDGAGSPGELLDDRLLVACGEGAVRILRVQREARAPQDAEAFLRGLPLVAGVRLG